MQPGSQPEPFPVLIKSTLNRQNANAGWRCSPRRKQEFRSLRAPAVGWPAARRARRTPPAAGHAPGHHGESSSTALFGGTGPPTSSAPAHASAASRASQGKRRPLLRSSGRRAGRRSLWAAGQGAAHSAPCGSRFALSTDLARSASSPRRSGAAPQACTAPPIPTGRQPRARPQPIRASRFPAAPKNHQTGQKAAAPAVLIFLCG